MNPDNLPKMYFLEKRLEVSYPENYHEQIWVIMKFPYAPA